MRSAKVPWGINCKSIPPVSARSSSSLFSPTYVPITVLIWRVSSSRPSPKVFTPALLLITVRSFVPLRRIASIRFSGMPHRPNPPTMMLAPSGTSATAASALGKTLFTKLSPKWPRGRLVLVHLTTDARSAQLVERAHIPDARPKRVALHFQNLFQVAEIVERPLVDHLRGRDFPDGLVHPFALELCGLERAQPFQVDLALAGETGQRAARVLPVVSHLDRAPFLVKRKQHGLILFDHRRHARPHAMLLHVVEVRQDFLYRPFVGRRTRLHFHRRHR